MSLVNGAFKFVTTVLVIGTGVACGRVVYDVINAPQAYQAKVRTLSLLHVQASVGCFVAMILIRLLSIVMTGRTTTTATTTATATTAAILIHLIIVMYSFTSTVHFTALTINEYSNKAACSYKVLMPMMRHLTSEASKHTTSTTTTTHSAIPFSFINKHHHCPIHHQAHTHTHTHTHTPPCDSQYTVMKRWQRWTLTLAVSLAIWLSVWMKVIALPLPQPIDDIVPYV
jgi:hypothetical protein